MLARSARKVRTLRFSVRSLTVESNAKPIPVSLIKNLRNATGAPIIECKKALEASDLNTDGALEWLRKRGANVVGKLSNNTTSVGLVCAAVDGNNGAIVEINSQTDFVVKMPEVQHLLKCAANALLSLGKDEESVPLTELKLPELGNQSIQTAAHELVKSTRENIEIGRSARLSVNQGIIVEYVHNKASESIGSIACLVALESLSEDRASLQQLGKKLAMHVVSSPEAPQFINRSEIPEEVLEKEKEIRMEQLANSVDLSSKSPAVVDKMVLGKMESFFKEVCLLEQDYALAGMEEQEGEATPTKKKKKTQVKDIIESCAKSIGADISVVGFVKIQAGQA